MNDGIEALASYNSDNDPLADLQRRVEQLENAQGSGYGPAITFYKRIIDRIEKADDIALEAKDRASRAYEATQEDQALEGRLWEDMEFFEAYLVTLEDKE